MPFILHAAWLPSDEFSIGGNLFLWAENTDFSVPDQSIAPAGNGTARSSNGRTRSHKAPSHPQQVSIGQLRSALASELQSFDPSSATLSNVTAWLPSLAGLPVSRGGLFQRNVTSENGNNDEPVLSPWQITGVTLPPLAGFTFLSHLTGRSSREDAPLSKPLNRIRFGNDMLFWSSTAKYVLEILVSQTYLPTLSTNATGLLEAFWRPSAADKRVEQLYKQLADAMPPVCRAYNLENLANAPLPVQLVEHFVTSMIDQSVRAWGINGSLPAMAPPAQEWMQGLFGKQRYLNLPPQPAHQLYQAWHSWVEQLYITSDANYRICLRLEEPKAETTLVSQESVSEAAQALDSMQWKLSYWLQSRENPQLLISAPDIWQATQPLHIGNRRIDQPQERLLAGINAASRLFSPIEQSLQSPHPEFCVLSTQDAYLFLRDIAPLLESSGFGVQVPDWWSVGHHMRLGLRLRLQSDEDPFDLSLQEDTQNDTKALRPIRRRGPIRYAWELTLGGQRLEPSEFEQMVAMQTPLLQLRGEWIELDPTQVKAAQQFLNASNTNGSISLLQAIQVAQGYSPPQNQEEELAATVVEQTQFQLSDNLFKQVDGLSALAIDTVELDQWLLEIFSRLQNSQPLEEVTEPAGFVGTLRPYQRRGLAWLLFLRELGLGACLADDMGLGKTIQAIALLLAVRVSTDSTDRMTSLLICPTSVVVNWRREMERFAPNLTVLVHHGTSRLTGEAFHNALPNYDLVITSFGTARRDIELLVPTQWGELIVDEAQNIKNPGAKQTQAVRRLQADYRFALTGTPVENHLDELWSIMELLNPGYLGSLEEFRQQYIVPIVRYNHGSRAARLRRLVQPFLLRRLKSDPTIISDLPEKQEMVVYCTLTSEQVELYEKAVADGLNTLQTSDGIQRRGLVLGLLTKLKQITNHPAHYLKQDHPFAGRSGKLSRLTEMLDEALSVGDQALVFTQFVEMGHILQQHLRETLQTEVLFLHGGTSATQRDKLVQAFQSKDGPPIFVLSLRAGGSGLNLTRANHVFHYDRWWNPAVENQATDRAFRIGQTRNVQVHKFVVAGTLEERINELLISKQALADFIVGSGEDWLTELDVEELRELLLLRRDSL